MYFGTTNPPPFVGNTVATSYVATTPGAGAYFWQIRPVGLGGTASGCNVWSFTKQDNTALPAGWSTGNTGAGTGSAGYNPCVQSSTQYTVSSTGYVPSITGEGIQAAFQTLCGNTTITTRVAGLSGGGWAGIMMRESLASGSKMVALKTQLTNQAIREARISTNGIKNSQTIPVPQIAEWLRIQRVGNIFTFSVSPNGVNWSPAGTITFTMNNCLLVGLFAESINVNTTTTALFDNVTTSGGVAPLAGDTGSGIEEAAHQQPEFSVYPNPTTGVVTVDLSAFQTPQARLQVYNANGQVVQTLELNTLENATERLDLSNYQNGIYLIRLQAEGYNDAVKRVVLFSHGRP